MSPTLNGNSAIWAFQTQQCNRNMWRNNLQFLHGRYLRPRTCPTPRPTHLGSPESPRVTTDHWTISGCYDNEYPKSCTTSCSYETESATSCSQPPHWLPWKQGWSSYVMLLLEVRYSKTYTKLNVLNIVLFSATFCTAAWRSTKVKMVQSAYRYHGNIQWIWVHI